MPYEPKPEFDHGRDVFGDEVVDEADPGSPDKPTDRLPTEEENKKAAEAFKRNKRDYEDLHQPSDPHLALDGDLDDDDIEPEKVGADSEPTLIRVAEWTEWIPGKLDENMMREHPDKKFVVYNGITGVMTSKSEKLVDIESISLQTTRKIEREEEGEPVTHYYKLYAFRAVLAENVSAGLITGVQDSMLGPLRQQFEDEAEDQPEDGKRDRRQDLVVVEHNRPEAVEGLGNRAQRRKTVRQKRGKGKNAPRAPKR